MKASLKILDHDQVTTYEKFVVDYKDLIVEILDFMDWGLGCDHILSFFLYEKMKDSMRNRARLRPGLDHIVLFEFSFTEKDLRHKSIFNTINHKMPFVAAALNNSGFFAKFMIEPDDED